MTCISDDGSLISVGRNVDSRILETSDDICKGHHRKSLHGLGLANRVSVGVANPNPVT